jgi:hypothetical protein
MENFRTIGRIFIHNAAIAEFLNETFFPLDIRIGNIADFIGMETIPIFSTLYSLREMCWEGGEDHFVPTRALANGIIDVGSMKLINAYPTLKVNFP